MILLMLTMLSCTNFNLDHKEKKNNKVYTDRVIDLSIQSDVQGLKRLFDQRGPLPLNERIMSEIITSSEEVCDILLVKLEEDGRLNDSKVNIIKSALEERYSDDNNRIEFLTDKFIFNLEDEVKGEIIISLANRGKWDKVRRYIEEGFPVNSIKDLNYSYYYKPEICLANLAVDDDLATDDIRDMIIARSSPEDLLNYFLYSKRDKSQLFWLNYLSLEDFNRVNLKEINFYSKSDEVTGKMLAMIKDDNFITSDNFVKIFFVNVSKCKKEYADTQRRQGYSTSAEQHRQLVSEDYLEDNFLLELYDENIDEFKRVLKFVNIDINLEMRLLSKFIAMKDLNTLNSISKQLKLNKVQKGRKRLVSIEQALLATEPHLYNSDFIKQLSSYLHYENLIACALLKNNKELVSCFLILRGRNGIIRVVDKIIEKEIDSNRLVWGGYNYKIYGNQDFVNFLLDNDIHSLSMLKELCSRNYFNSDVIDLGVFDKFLEKGYEITEDLFNKAFNQENYEICKYFVEKGFETDKTLLDVVNTWGIKLNKLRIAASFLPTPKDEDIFEKALKNCWFTEEDIIDENIVRTLHNFGMMPKWNKNYLEIYLSNSTAKATRKNIYSLSRVSKRDGNLANFPAFWESHKYGYGYNPDLGNKYWGMW